MIYLAWTILSRSALCSPMSIASFHLFAASLLVFLMGT